MELASDTRERIFSAADSLYQQPGQAGFPTVDAVRKIARVNMNDASAGMKQWRRAHTLQTAPAISQVPDSVRQASAMALTVLWRDAQQAANEEFRVARANWENERVESETVHKQLADAFEAQAVELGSAATELTHLHTEIASLRADKAGVDEELKAMVLDLASALAAAELSAVRAEEMRRSTTDLRKELDHAHDEAARLRSELEREGKKRIAEISEVRQASNLALARAEAERDAALYCASEARELAAALRGQIDVAKEQNVALLQVISSSKLS